MKSAPEPHTRSGTSCRQRLSAYAEYPGMRLNEGRCSIAAHTYSIIGDLVTRINCSIVNGKGLY
jgi:hypothetical protein